MTRSVHEEMNMKFNRILAAIAFVGLAACTKDKEPAPTFPEIPNDITFDKGGLESLSDAEYNDAVKTWQDMSDATDLSDQLFTKDEDDKSRTEREKQYQEFSAEKRAAVDTIRAQCAIDEQMTPGQWPDDPQAGATMTESNSGVVNGPGCPVLTNMNHNSLMTLISRDQFFSMDLGTRMSYSLESTAGNPNIVPGLGYRFAKLSGTTDARVKSTMGSIKEAFMHSDLQGEFDLAGGSKVSYTATVDSLTKEGSLKVVVIRVMFSREGGRTVTYSHHIRYGFGGLKVGEEKYFGNRQLGAVEIASLGKFPFALEELAGIDYVE
jgi:hypothetical protein